MTRYWIATQHLEKAVWYFAPDGRVYENLATGFSEADLAAHQGRHGTYDVAGSTLTISWSDGTTRAGEMEMDATGFAWDTGLFVPVGPFDGSRSIAGTYTGGTSLSFAGGSTLASNTLELRADGTYARHGAASISGEGGAYAAGGQSAAGGRWSLSGYTLTLAGANGEVVRGIAFPFDDERTPVYPDQMFFNGMMFTRQ
jgi:hypothetical protein